MNGPVRSCDALLHAGADGVTRAWDLGGGEVVQEYPLPAQWSSRGPVSALAFSSDSTLLATSSHLKCISIYNMRRCGLSTANTRLGDMYLVKLLNKGHIRTTPCREVFLALFSFLMCSLQWKSHVGSRHLSLVQIGYFCRVLFSEGLYRSCFGNEALRLFFVSFACSKDTLLSLSAPPRTSSILDLQFTHRNCVIGIAQLDNPSLTSVYPASFN